MHKTKRHMRYYNVLTLFLCKSHWPKELSIILLTLQMGKLRHQDPKVPHAERYPTGKWAKPGKNLRFSESQYDELSTRLQCLSTDYSLSTLRDKKHRIHHKRGHQKYFTLARKSQRVYSPLITRANYLMNKKESRKS